MVESVVLRRQITDFLVIADCGSFSGAARTLFTTQPALSQEIAALERELGFSLFTRSTQGVVLTSAGIQFYQEIREIKSLSESAVKHARDTAGRRDMQIRIGIVSVSDSLIYQAPSTMFLDRYPNHEVTFVHSEYGQADRERCVLEGRYDFIRCEYHASLERAGLAFTDLMMDENCLLVSKNHPLATRESLGLDELDGFKIAILDNGADSMAEVVRTDILLKSPDASIETAPLLDSGLISRVQIGELLLLATMSENAGVYSTIVGIPLRNTRPARMGIMHSKKLGDEKLYFLRLLARQYHASADSNHRIPR